MPINLIKKNDYFKIFLRHQCIGSISFLKSSSCWYVSYFLDPKFRNQGIMSKALTQALDHYKNCTIKASVEISRAESIKVLMNNGFTEIYTDESAIDFIKEN